MTKHEAPTSAGAVGSPLERGVVPPGFPARDTLRGAQLRAAQLALLLANGEAVTTWLVRELYGVSAPTAKRDLAVLREALPVEQFQGRHPALMLQDAKTPTLSQRLLAAGFKRRPSARSLPSDE